MPKVITPAQEAQAITLRKMGWPIRGIAEQLGIKRTTAHRIVREVSHNGKATSVGQTRPMSHNGKATSVGHFKSWCGRVEDFTPDPETLRFDLIVADPPWNVSRREAVQRKARKTAVAKSFGEWDYFDDDEHYLGAVRAWLQRFHDLSSSRAWCWFWCSWRYISYIATIAIHVGWRVLNPFIWYKTNPAPLMGAGTFLSAIEPMLILRKPDSRLRLGSGHLPNGLLTGQVASSERVKDAEGRAVNLAQKPVPLIQLIVEWCTDPGDWVWDAFAGSGSASLAALSMRHPRNAYAVEAERHQLTHILGRLQAKGLA